MLEAIFIQVEINLGDGDEKRFEINNNNNLNNRK